MNAYQRSQDLILEADELLHSGEITAARERFRMAADLQWSLVDSLPPDRARTLSVYVLSAATLYYRGQDLDRAEQIIHSLFTRPDIESYCRTQLRDLLARVWNERQMEQMGYGHASSPLSVTFRNGSILYGIAPTDAVDTPIRSVLNLFQRIAAWRVQLPFSHKSHTVLSENYRAFSSEPVPGSYRIDLSLARDPQLSLDLAEVVTLQPTPDEVLDSFVQLLTYTTQADYDELCSFVPDVDYRRTLVRLVRNIVPDGKLVGEVEFRRSGDTKESAVTLLPAHRQGVKRMITQSQPPKEPGSGEDDQAKQITGVLRAVDLDGNRLRLDTGGDRMEFSKADDIVDDVVGPLLNKKVAVTGSYVKSRRKQPQFIATDIELFAGSDAE